MMSGRRASNDVGNPGATGPGSVANFALMSISADG